MSEFDFDIDKEIDKITIKLLEQFKYKLKKLIIKSEKLVLKHYILTQKSTKKQPKKLKISFPPKREKEYNNHSDDSGYSSD